jgi:hypothetical protein
MESLSIIVFQARGVTLPLGSFPSQFSQRTFSSFNKFTFSPELSDPLISGGLNAIDLKFPIGKK